MSRSNSSLSVLIRAQPSTQSAWAASSLLAACSSVPLETGGAPVESRDTSAAAAGAGASGAAAGGASESQVTPIDLTKNGNAAAPNNLPHTVYFDFDSFVLRDDARPIIEANAKALVANRKLHVTIEGNTDDRGGREYNLALGQKRSEAVGKALELLGVNASQIEAVSFGKERPAVQGDDDAARAKNRRADIAYR